MEDAPVILVYSNWYTDFVSTKIKGGVVNIPGYGVSDMFRWWINEQKAFACCLPVGRPGCRPMQ